MDETPDKSPGLKIALAAFIALLVIASVSAYFLDTGYHHSMNEIAGLNAEVKRIQDQGSNEKEQLTTIIRKLRDPSERHLGTILDRPDGSITFVNAESGEVRVSINRGMGARPKMKLSVFDAGTAIISTEKPKGTIELTKVGDQFSIARITKTVSPIDPLRTGDIIYTPAWSPNNPTRFALVGKIDINRDDKDDREELKKMIQEAGGVIDFDLPPLEIGKETGQITPRIDWYVIDDRIVERVPFRGGIGEKKLQPSLLLQVKLAQRVGEVVKEARLDGIRPMPIGRLLSFLGYEINPPKIDRAEKVNSDGRNEKHGLRIQGHVRISPTESTGTASKAGSAGQEPGGCRAERVPV